MNELKCPHCGEVFQIDENGYNQIIKQVRDSEFQKDLKERQKELEKNTENTIEIEKLKKEKEKEELLKKKETEISLKNQEIEKLKNELKNSQTKQDLAIAQIVEKKNEEIAKKTKEIFTLQSSLSNKENERKIAETELKKELMDKYENELKMKDEELERLKDFKLRQSTKMVGEDLEQFCLNEFNKIRMTAFSNAYFEKDNDIKTGSKGDFIFKEEKNGIEIISIMFEMKNEVSTTTKKHKNEDFFKELDKDRREKNCEYAVLVSMLEADNDYYNTGIVDVSYRYDKMYVVRPEFFIQIISLLRNAALNSLQYKEELAVVKNQQLDIQNFESNMLAFKDAFSRNYRIASEKFKTAIDEIDKTIEHLQKTKAALLSSENNLRLANNKAENLSIKKLTKNAESVRQMFAEQKES